MNEPLGTGRSPWIDTAKGVAIILVLLGHTTAIGPGLTKYLYSFHMPLFFYLSGAVLQSKHLDIPFVEMFRRQLRSLVAPYLWFALLSYGAWFLVFRHFGAHALEGVHPLRPLLGTLYGNGVDDWMQHNVPLWFLPCLFVTQCLYWAIHRLGRPGRVLLGIVALSVLGYADLHRGGPRLPWGSDIALTAVVFLAAGHLSRPALDRLSAARLPPVWWAVMAGLFGIQLLASAMNTRVDLNFGHVGNYLWFYVAAWAGIALWLLLSLAVGRSRHLAALGQNTLYLFALHPLVYPCVTGVFVFGLGLPASFKEPGLPYSPLVAALYTAVALVVLRPVGPKLRAWKYGPQRLASLQVVGDH